MLDAIKNYIQKNKFFWQYRHFVHRDVWLNYFNSYKSERRNFYSNYAETNKCRTFFEFGCASGPNLKNIQSRVSFETFFFGYDINKAAIEFAKQKFIIKTSNFSDLLTKNKLEKCLLSWGSSAFDLAIYDRVLYLLNENQVSNHFSEYGLFFNSIIIDDFHNSEFLDYNDAYYSKDYQKILSKFGFKIIQNDASEHPVSGPFCERSSRRLVFNRI